MKLFDGKYKKAITFSFDDGNVDDIRLIEIFNKYGLKATFNLNSGLMCHNSSWTYKEVKEVRHMNYYGNENVYDGHEIACHSYTHPHLEQLEKEDLYNQIFIDRKILEALYDRDICGMAYPFGSYSDDVIVALKDCGLIYSRGVMDTYSFDMPQNPLVWQPTCHFKNEKTDELADEFLNSNPDKLQIFYIWGHSYELVTEEDWQKFDDFCKKLSGRNDIYYCTNEQLLKNIK